MTTSEFVDRSAEPDEAFDRLLARLEEEPACDDDLTERLARVLYVEQHSVPWEDGPFWAQRQARDLATVAVDFLRGSTADTAHQQVQRILALADELDAKSEELWLDCKGSSPDNPRRANPHTEGESDAYESAAARIRTAVAGPRRDDTGATA